MQKFVFQNFHKLILIEVLKIKNWGIFKNTWKDHGVHKKFDSAATESSVHKLKITKNTHFKKFKWFHKNFKYS